MTKMQTLPWEMQEACFQHVSQFKDVCSIALVCKDMAHAVVHQRKMMVMARQLRVQCGGCGLCFRAPGLRLFNLREPSNEPAWPWECPACPVMNEVSQKYNAVLPRDGWHIPRRRTNIRVRGRESDFVRIPPTPAPDYEWGSIFS